MLTLNIGRIWACEGQGLTHWMACKPRSKKNTAVSSFLSIGLIEGNDNLCLGRTIFEKITTSVLNTVAALIDKNAWFTCKNYFITLSKKYFISKGMTARLRFTTALRRWQRLCFVWQWKLAAAQPAGSTGTVKPVWISSSTSVTSSRVISLLRICPVGRPPPWSCQLSRVIPAVLGLLTGVIPKCLLTDFS